MLERTNNKKIDSIEENYCFGEACLIFNYKDMKRSVVVASKKDLKAAKQLLNWDNKNYKIRLENNALLIVWENNLYKIELVNETHAIRLKEILEESLR